MKPRQPAKPLTCAFGTPWPCGPCAACIAYVNACDQPEQPPLKLQSRKKVAA
jgi:hypothetical protein